MKKIFHVKKWYLLWMVFYIANIAVSASSVSPEALKKLDDHVKKKIYEGKAIGCAIAVLDHDKVVFLKTYGVKKKGTQEKIDANTIFQIGSISKPITATVLAILHKSGGLNVHDSAQIHLPYLDPETKIHHILAHTTGYNRMGWNNKIESSVFRPQLLKELIATPCLRKPGKEFDYHNVVYSLLEEILECSQKLSFKDIVYERLFKPLGMKRATVGYDDFIKQDNKAWPHTIGNKSKKFYPSKSYSKLYHGAVASAAGVNASVTDMISFLRLQMIGDDNLLSKEDLELFHQPHTSAPDLFLWLKDEMKGKLRSYYGLGWRIVENDTCRVVFHGGYVKGFISFIGFLPDKKIGIIVLHNGQNIFSAETGIRFLSDWV